MRMADEYTRKAYTEHHEYTCTLYRTPAVFGTQRSSAPVCRLTSGCCACSTAPPQRCVRCMHALRCCMHARRMDRRELTAAIAAVLVLGEDLK